MCIPFGTGYAIASITKCSFHDAIYATVVRILSCVWADLTVVRFILCEWPQPTTMMCHFPLPNILLPKIPYIPSGTSGDVQHTTKIGFARCIASKKTHYTNVYGGGVVSRCSRYTAKLKGLLYTCVVSFIP